ncbi:MAG: NUDIX hydrolase [Xanthomonadales bacterium]|jgi:ADP-ribose pyrophosphatase|nr:NUDIX hydrolase [Xanthomonadales bacterium]MDH3926011.1 NUDIX hydrolase [Xanthomonadales bacterium]MDH3941152.1 NUDIX hydrolase [Xanthomonadales bacterium]MDH3999886.1 NUDIX hydrolase [Xanthomonadales bacterium]
MKNDTLHFRGRYLSMLERDGWEFVSRCNASNVVALVAVTSEDEIVLVEQFRKPVASFVIEIPAGLVGDNDDPNESILVAAARELQEETGFSAAHMELLMQCPSSAGMSDEIISFIVAEGLTRTGPGGGDDSENIITHTIPLDAVDDWLTEQRNAGKMLDPKVYSALHWLQSGIAL